MEKTRVSVVPAQSGRVILARLRRDTDLITGLIEACRRSGIVTGVIQVVVGSLRHAEVTWAIPSLKTKRGSERTAPIKIAGPVELVAGQGVLCLSEPEKPVIHFHGLICDPDGRTWSGHFFPGGNPVHATMDVVITEITGARLSWEYDEEIDLELAVPQPE